MCSGGAAMTEKLPIFDEIAMWRWLLGIQYKNECTSTNSMGVACYRGMHRSAAGWYARRYHAEHGVLPSGTHHVKCFFGRNGIEGDLEHPLPGYTRSYIRADITFLPPPAELVPLPRRDPERSE
jgi:hypothetical protein